MPRPSKPRTEPKVNLSGPLPEEVPEDVRAELAMEEVQPDAATIEAMSGEPLPEDVLAELDAEARARKLQAYDPDARPAFDDEAEER